MNTVEKIAKLVKNKGISEKEFVKEIGLNRSAFTDWRSGKSNSFKRHADIIADYFGVTTDYLLRDGEENNFTLMKSEEKKMNKNNYVEKEELSNILSSSLSDSEKIIKIKNLIGKDNYVYLYNADGNAILDSMGNHMYTEKEKISFGEDVNKQKKA